MHTICINKLPAKQRNAARRCATLRSAARRCAAPRDAAPRCVARCRAAHRCAPLRSTARSVNAALGCRQYLHSVGRPLKPPSITNRLLAIVHTKPIIALLAPKLVAMATSLRPSISAMSSLDSLTPKTYPLESNSESLDAIQPKLCGFKVYLPHPHTKGTADLRDR